MTNLGIKGLLEAAIYVADLDRAEGFYGNLLGLEKILRVDGRHVFFRCGQAVLLCFIAEKTKEPPPKDALPVPTHGAQGAGHICFSVDGEDLDDIVLRCEAHGVEIEADFHWPNGARSVYVRDPDETRSSSPNQSFGGWNE
jgi:catechol 2,3-dioxygenase-like lactoylglutathione lyase family enzyme